MDFKIDEYDEINLLIIHANGHFKASTWNQMLFKDVSPFVEKHANEPVYVITVCNNFTVDFPEFIKFMKNLKERRAADPATNLKQFLVGDDEKWLNNFRNIYLKQFNETLGMFDNVDDAIQYVRDDFVKMSSS